MGRWSRSEPDSTRKRAIVGAAKRINLGRRSEVEKLRLRQSTPWQKTAWLHYDQIGEVKYAFNYAANTLSRCRLYAAYKPDDRDGPPVPIGSVGGLDRDLVQAARQELAKLEAAHGGIAGVLRSYALNRLVAGECYLIEVADALGIYSTQEVQVEATNQIRLITRRNLRQLDTIELPQDTFVARLWQPHPAYSDEADSSMMGIREPADELLMLSRMIRASAMSQVNAGILYVADELSFMRSEDVDNAADEDDPDSPDQGENDVFEEELNAAMTEPVDDDLSPSSVVPMLVRGPADMSENAIRKIDLSRPFDKTAVDLRNAALDRVLNGLDMPKDVVTGLANVRYSNGQQIAEDLYKAHVEPAAVSFTEGYTTTRLQPALLARGFDPAQVARITTWYDASEITTNANRSVDADAGHDRILISDATWRRDHGYSEDDAPDQQEALRRVAEKYPMAQETVVQIMAALIPIMGQMAKDNQIVLQPSSMRPQLPPHAPAVQIANAGADAVAPGATAPAGSSGAPPPPGGTPAPVHNNASPGPAQVQAPGTQTVVAAGGGGAPLPEPGAPHTGANRDAQRLVDIERRLRATLQTMLTDMTDRALEKAGSKIVSKVRNDPAAMAKIKGVPKTLVASALGRDAVIAAGFTDQQLAAESVDEAEPKYIAAIKQAQAQAARILGAPVGETADIGASWSLLKPLLASFVAKALFRKQRDDDNGYVPKVPMDDVRLALARAGGSAPARPTVHGAQPGAIVNPKSINALSTKHDAEALGFRWVYGISDNHFEPHLQLDGAEFDSWTSPVLRNPGSFPAIEYLHPGDHQGCECDWLPQFVARQPHEGRVEEHIGDITEPGMVQPLAAAGVS